MTYQVIRRKSDNVVILYGTTVREPIEALNEEKRTYSGDIPDNIDRLNTAISNSGVISLIASRQPPATNLAIERKLRVYEACQAGYANNLPHWPDLRTGTITNKQLPRVATIKWIYHGGAILDLMIDGNFRNGLGTVIAIADVDAVITAWERTMRGSHPNTRASVPVWYGVVETRSDLAQWAAASIADGAAIFSDFVAVNTGAIRGLDGAYIPLSGNTIPANFTTEQPTLRRTA